MRINYEKYKLPIQNYIESETIKKQIVIGHTYSNEFKHFTKWTTRLNGKYKKTAAYSIDSSGGIYNHFDPIYSSTILQNNDLDKKSIVILLENDGWLLKDIKKNEFINWVGHIYNNAEDVVEKRWRGNLYWAPYSKEQFESTLNLVNKLCEDFYIPKFAVPHNTKIDDLDNFKGVLYKSNVEKYYTDLSPAWNYEDFKYKLEN